MKTQTQKITYHINKEDKEKFEQGEEVLAYNTSSCIPLVSMIFKWQLCEVLADPSELETRWEYDSSVYTSHPVGIGEAQEYPTNTYIKKKTLDR